MAVTCEPIESPPTDRNKSASGLTFCDLSSFYAPTGGGIRTYHQAKLEWFASQQRHQYVLLYPGSRFAVDRVAANVTIVTVYGLPVRAGYRLPMDIAGIRAFIKTLRPDILETGDPWISGPLGLLFKRWGYTRLVSSFYHTAPIHTYIDPWTRRGNAFVKPRARLRSWAEGRSSAHSDSTT